MRLTTLLLITAIAAT
jgi:hypothetical protein